MTSKLFFDSEQNAQTAQIIVAENSNISSTRNGRTLIFSGTASKDKAIRILQLAGMRGLQNQRGDDEDEE